MLTWMQHHKKYLVITIWVSVIAFIGASAVGWGDYSFNFNKNLIASVNDKKITLNEFNNRYNQIFNFYNQISGGNLNQELAKKIGIENMVLNSLIEDKLLLEFAYDIGLRTNDEEIIQDLKNTREFQNENGYFDKNIYYQLLAQNNLTEKTYEEMVKNKITLQKLENSFKFINNDLDLQMLTSALFMQDLLDIKIIKANENEIIKDENEMKKLWNENKEKFKTIPTYEIQTFFINNKLELQENEILEFYNKNKLNYKDSNGKILPFELAKNEIKKDLNIQKLKSFANKQYIKLSKNELNFEKDLNISENDTKFPIELIKNAKQDEVLKPFIYDDGYMIIKIRKINPSKIKTFLQAENEIFNLYKKEEIKKQLISRSQKELKNFSSNLSTGFVNRNSSKNEDKISDKLLSDAEFSYFLINVFNKDSNSSYVLFDDKSVVYKIKKQKLFSELDLIKNKIMIEQDLEKIKYNQLKQELIDKLKEEYTIKIYYKGN